jgi:hypothetical protein
MTFDNKNNNTIIIDVNARSRRKKKQKILCVLCPNIQLEPISTTIEENELTYKCPRCKNTYQLGYEILEHEDDFESSHEDEDIELAGLDSNGSVGLLVANDEDDEDKYKTKSDIPIPKYMKDSETTKVIEYREE